MLKKVEEKLDQEWIDLILEARRAGMHTEEIRKFLKEQGESEGKQFAVQQMHD